MPNRYHSPFSTLKIRGATPPPTGARGPRPSLPNESVKGRPTSKGNARSDRGLGMKVVKTFVTGEYMKGNPGQMRSPSKGMVGTMMHEVFTDEPSTVTRAKVSGSRKRKMMQAIAFSKARKASR